MRAYAFINRADTAGRDNEEAAEIIREPAELEFINCPLGSRKAFSNAATSAKKKTKKDVIPVTLRLPSEFESRIEKVLQNRPLKIPRHTWLLEELYVDFFLVTFLL